MRRASLVACLLCALHGEAAATDDPLHDLAVPGGIAAAARVMDDPRDVDPAWFAIDLVQRFYNQPADALRTHDPSLRRLLDWLAVQRPTQRATRQATQRAPTSGDAPADVVPSPLSADAWRAVLGITDAAVPDPDIGHVLASHDAGLLYVALLRMPPATRTWLASDLQALRALLPHASALTIVAPVLERDAEGWLLPGGTAARPAWERLTGHRADDARFLEALLARDAGWIAVLADVAGSLSVHHQRLALGLDPRDARAPPNGASSDPGRLLRALRRASPEWVPRHRPFWRPTLDPALLLAQLPADADGLQLPGPPRAWSAILAGGRLDERAIDDTATSSRVQRRRLTPAWIVEQVFKGPSARRRLAYDQVLFGQRLLRDTAPLSLDAAVAIHAMATHPQLVLTLERLGVRQPATYASVVHLAHRLESGLDPGLDSGQDAHARVVQLQAALMLLVHAQAGGSLRTEDVEPAVAMLVEALADDGPGVRSWLAQTVDAGGAGQSLDERVIRFAAGPRASTTIDWEGTTYAIDPAAATLSRIARLRGAVATSRRDASRDREADVTGWLLELTYALAMGAGDALPLRPADASARHTFGRAASDRSLAWAAPVVAVDEGTSWHVRGSVLGLDVALAPLAIRRASLRPPPRRPSLNTADRRVLIESLALVRRGRLHDTLSRETHQLIVKGRTVLADALSDPDRCSAVVARLPVGYARASLLWWMCRRPAGRLLRAVSVRETIAIGAMSSLPAPAVAQPLATDPVLPGYGALAQPLSGAWGLWIPPHADPGRRGGHWGTGVAAAHFADLHVRVLGLLGELELPATLLPEALAGATWEFVTHVPAAYPDDWFALNEMIWRLDVESVERALALHTGDGVLRAVDVP